MGSAEAAAIGLWDVSLGRVPFRLGSADPPFFCVALLPSLVRDVCRLLRTKLEHPYPQVQLLTLHALDACFRGCGRAFHDVMAAKDVLDAVVRLAVSETLDVDEEVREAAGAAIRGWANATRLEPFQDALDEVTAAQGSPVAHTVLGARDPRVYGLDPTMVRALDAT